MERRGRSRRIRRIRRRGLGKVRYGLHPNRNQRSQRKVRRTRARKRSQQGRSRRVRKGRRPRKNVGKIQRELVRNHLAHPHLCGRDVIRQQAILQGGRPS